MQWEITPAAMLPNRVCTNWYSGVCLALIAGRGAAATGAG